VIPCQTISHALVQEGAADVGGTIHVAKGTYTEQVHIGALNSSVTITGSGSKKTIIQPPASGLTAGASDPNSANPLYAVVEVSGGANNVLLQGLTVSGTNGVGALDSDGHGCSQQFVGIYFNDASGTLNSVNVNGIDLPADQFGTCLGGRGIYVANDGSASTSDVSMTAVSLLSPQCTTTTTVPLPGNTTYVTPEILPVKNISKKKGCKGFSGGPILVDGGLLQATPFGAHAVQVTGTTPYALPAGSTVDFNPYTPAYHQAGIVCEDARTACTITSSTVQGDGPNDLVTQSGIEVLGASATIGGLSSAQGVTVSGNSFTGGANGQAAAGLRLLNAGTLDVSHTTTRSNDVNIDAAWVPGFGPTSPAGYPPLSAGRSFSDGQTTDGETALSSPSGASFQASDIGRSVNFAPATTTVAAGSTGLSLPLTTIDVASTAGFAPSVPMHVTSSNGPQTVTCTGVSASPVAFTGCSGGTGTLSTGGAVSQTLPSTYIAKFVSPSVVLMSEPALVTGSSLSVVLGSLPGTWTISGNSASDALAGGGSIGVAGYGDGILLDSTDSCVDANQNANVVLQSNTATDNASAGISLSGASCAQIGGSVLGQGNSATGNATGLALNGPGTDNYVACLSPTPCGPLFPAYDSTANIVVGNSLSSNGFGVVVGGTTALQQYGGPPAAGPGSATNTLDGNTWVSNSVANVVDFTGWAGVTCSSSCTDALGTALTGGPTGTAYTSVTLASSVSVSAGTVLQISQAGLPTLNVLVVSTVTSATIPVTSFTVPAGDTYSTAGNDVSVNPFPFSAMSDTWGIPTADSCDPSANGSSSFDGFTFNAGYFAC
jgi:hypothetical protein